MHFESKGEVRHEEEALLELMKSPCDLKKNQSTQIQVRVPMIHSLCILSLCLRAELSHKLRFFHTFSFFSRLDSLKE